jgi:hypothetical protein
MNEAEGTEQPASASRQTFWMGFRWIDLWTAAGGLAGATALVYVLGGFIEGLRLHHAGAPVSDAIAVVPKSTLFALAIDALLLRVLVQIVVVGGALLWASKWTEAHEQPNRVAEREPKAKAKAEERALRRKQRKENPSRRRRAARRAWSWSERPRRWAGRQVVVVAKPVWVAGARWVAPVWRPTLGRVRHKEWTLYVLWFLLVLPWTVVLLIGLTTVYIQFRIIFWLARVRRQGRFGYRWEAILVALTGALGIFVLTLGSEVVQPHSLPSVAVSRTAHLPKLVGGFVANTPDGVYLVVKHHLIVIPQRRVSEIVVTDSEPPKEEKGRNLIQRL